ncbi:FkbM family methyltransferase [Nocardioides furvisabuli]|uniref:FkbM family methyltransferase n=1 Tax=Nocardioides furvisabuli TaxID=375542 RepID=UPI001E3D0E41|nr:FkbM family methyltransferase [Nocardioides furvisabuli]
MSATGHRIYVDPSDGRGAELVRSAGAFNRGTLAIWDRTLELDDWDVVVDVGVNYGEMLLGAQLPPGARLIGFEPNPRVLPHLRRSLDESGLAVDLHEAALGAAESEATFAVDTEWSGRSGIAASHRTDAAHDIETFDVPVRTLDSELSVGESEKVCVKVDVEGAEFDVLAGAQSLRQRAAPWAILVEVLHMDGFEKAYLAEEYTMRALDHRVGELVTIPPVSARRVDELLSGGWLHGQDVVLTKRHAP